MQSEQHLDNHFGGHEFQGRGHQRVNDKCLGNGKRIQKTKGGTATQPRLKVVGLESEQIPDLAKRSDKSW